MPNPYSFKFGLGPGSSLSSLNGSTSGYFNELNKQINRMQNPTYGFNQFSRLANSGIRLNDFSQMMAMRGGSGLQAQHAYQQRMRQAGTDALNAFGQFRLGVDQNIGQMIGTGLQAGLEQRRQDVQWQMSREAQNMQWQMMKRAQRASFMDNLLGIGGFALGSLLGPVGGALGQQFGSYIGGLFNR